MIAALPGRVIDIISRWKGEGEGGVIAGYRSLIYLCGVLAGLVALQEIFCIENQTKIRICVHQRHLV